MAEKDRDKKIREREWTSYQAPKIYSYSAEELRAALGPAVAVYGDP